MAQPGDDVALATIQRGVVGLHQAIALERVWEGQRRNIRLWRDDGTFTVPAPDIYWTYTSRPVTPTAGDLRLGRGHAGYAAAEIQFHMR